VSRQSEFDYVLPEELISQQPAADRASARLLVLGGEAAWRHARVRDLPDVLRQGDVLVLNDTRVIAARVGGRRPSGGRLEVLFVRTLGPPHEWEVLVRGAPRPGERVFFPGGQGEWVGTLGGGRWRVRMHLEEGVEGWLERCGAVPLPPYVRRPSGPSAADRERYQTVYARTPGAVAAPTAGLHLTTDLLAQLGAAGVEVVSLTLHVGPGSFLPIREANVEAHVMEPEPYHLPAPTAERVLRARAEGRRIVAVGTTTVRALESASSGGAVVPGDGQATLFIRPGHRFRVVDALITNFHLPRSPLLALVAAFAGWERIRAAYEEAVRERYRFYSFGDAMLIQ
jgi:S-adenosylmethionine:tRNA ribosyltransferase-isomerase